MRHETPVRLKRQPLFALRRFQFAGALPIGALLPFAVRRTVKPGISGWAQVSQGHVAEVEDVHRKLQYDFHYIKYFSPWLDLLIVFRRSRRC